MNRHYRFLSVACIAGYGWMLYQVIAGSAYKAGATVCLFRHVTGMPCPSCGSTRSVFAILHGNFAEAWATNPLGIILAALLVIMPFWILGDLITRKSSLFRFYRRAEAVIRKPGVAITLIIMVLINWIWNISKGL